LVKGRIVTLSPLTSANAFVLALALRRHIRSGGMRTMRNALMRGYVWLLPGPFLLSYSVFCFQFFLIFCAVR